MASFSSTSNWFSLHLRPVAHGVIGALTDAFGAEPTLAIIAFLRPKVILIQLDHSVSLVRIYYCYINMLATYDFFLRISLS